MNSGRNRWFVDSPLEGAGFEPSVPRERVCAIRDRVHSLQSVRRPLRSTSMTATDRCCLASTFMDNTCWSTPNSISQLFAATMVPSPRRLPHTISRSRRRPPASLAGFGSRSRPTISRHREIRQRRLQGS